LSGECRRGTAITDRNNRLEVASPASRRAEALALAQDLLDDIELARLAPIDVARKTSRLARLLDDSDAIGWLRYELTAYPNPLTRDATNAARRSNREAGSNEFWTASLERLSSSSAAAKERLAGLSAGSTSGEWALAVEREKQTERNALQKGYVDQSSLLAHVVGAFHLYAADRYQELRFGSAVESAFEVVRKEVDGRIAELVPAALPMISAAFENATSDNPEHWANAAATCRRLLKEVADALRPPGPDVERPDGKSIKMGDGNYVNRLVGWIMRQAEGETRASLINAELEFLGRRLDATVAAGNKGTHDHVSKTDASRFITATYLLLGDILALSDESNLRAVEPDNPSARAIEPDDRSTDDVDMSPVEGTPDGRQASANLRQRTDASRGGLVSAESSTVPPVVPQRL
jgi:hypothetical protein